MNAGSARASCGRALFPMFVDLTDRPCLVVGAGPVAGRKAERLVSFGAKVDLVAPSGNIPDGTAATFGNRPFADADVEGRALVVAATDDRALNARIAGLCRVRGIPVNVVDDPALCTFVFPAVLRKGPVVVAVSSGGACPVAAQVVRDRVSACVSDHFYEKVAEFGKMRERIKAEHPDLDERRVWMRKELESC